MSWNSVITNLSDKNNSSVTCVCVVVNLISDIETWFGNCGFRYSILYVKNLKRKIIIIYIQPFVFSTIYYRNNLRLSFSFLRETHKTCSWQLFTQLRQFERSLTCHDSIHYREKSVKKKINCAFYSTVHTPLTRERRDSVWSKSRTIFFGDCRFACALGGREQLRWIVTSRRKKRRKKFKKIIIFNGKGSADRDVGSPRDRGRSREREKENTAGAGGSKARA